MDGGLPLEERLKTELKLTQSEWSILTLHDLVLHLRSPTPDVLLYCAEV